MPLDAFAATLASEAPAPGGGSASAAVGAIGAALLEMVCALTLGKEKYREAEGALRPASEELRGLRAALLASVDLDSAAYEGVSRALGLPKGTDAEKEARRAAMQSALKAATDVPLDVARACSRGLALAPVVAARGNPNAVTDAGCGARFLHAGLSGALYNVAINLASIKDADFVASRSAEAEDLRRSGEGSLAAALAAVDSALSK